VSTDRFIVTQGHWSGGGGGGGTVDGLIRGVGCSEYALLCAPYDYRAFLEAIQEEGCRHTRITCWNAWETGIPGTRAGYVPFKMRSDGVFDLYDWRADYFDRLTSLSKEANRRGILPVFSVKELYTWSERKGGTPDKRLQPWQNNVNGLYWSDRDSDAVWGIIATPGDWIWSFAEKFTEATEGQGCTVAVETGNEMPEKALHARIYDAFRTAGFRGVIQINRQEDKPSMYANMIEGVEAGGGDKRAYGALSWHTKSHMGYLDEVFNGEPDDRPSTFRQMWDHSYAGPFYDPKRMVMSSDGCRSYNDRIDTYNWDELVPVALHAIEHGAAYEHQSCTKMRVYLGGTWDPNDVHVYDSKLLRPAVSAWEAVR
jgi:hypothetical protein